MSASAACPETAEVCGRACGSHWCVLKAGRVAVEQALAEVRVRRVPAAVRLAEAPTVEAKAVHAGEVPGGWGELIDGRLPGAGATSADEAKAVHAGPVLQLDPGLADMIRRERELAGAPRNAKPVHPRGVVVLDGAAGLVAELPAVRDPLPLRPVPATDERPAVGLPPVPPAPRPAIAGMRFTWTTEE